MSFWPICWLTLKFFARIYRWLFNRVFRVFFRTRFLWRFYSRLNHVQFSVIFLLPPLCNHISTIHAFFSPHLLPFSLQREGEVHSINCKDKKYHQLNISTDFYNLNAFSTTMQIRISISIFLYNLHILHTNTLFTYIFMYISIFEFCEINLFSFFIYLFQWKGEVNSVCIFSSFFVSK